MDWNFRKKPDKDAELRLYDSFAKPTKILKQGKPADRREADEMNLPTGASPAPLLPEVGGVYRINEKMAYQPAAQLKAEYGREREKLKTHHEGERQLTKEHYATKRSEFFGKAKTALTDAKDAAMAAVVAAGTSGYDLLKAGYHSLGEGVIEVGIERRSELNALGGRQTGEVLDLTHTYAGKIDESIKGVNGHIGELKTEEAKIRKELGEVTGAKWGARYEKLKLKVAKATL